MNETSDLKAIRQEHETWLAELEGLAVEAIASNNWDPFYAHVVDFQNEYDLHGESVIAIEQNLTVRSCCSMDVNNPKDDCYDAYQFMIRYFNGYYLGILIVAIAALQWEGKLQLADKLQEILQSDLDESQKSNR
jgi:hypothetical protein